VESPPPELFAAVAREVGLLLDVDASHMGRYERDGTATVVGAWSRGGEVVPIGTQVELDGESVAGLVFRAARPARIHDYEHASGPTAALSRKLGMRSAVGAPIVVDKRLWGVMNASTKQDRPLPPDVESRIAAFTELVATAISNTEARAQVGQLADEQAALRRVATLVARESPAAEVFAAVAEEVLRALDVEITRLCPGEPGSELVAEALGRAERANVELRELARGIHPSVLTKGGLRAGVDQLASRTPVPVEIDVPVGRLPTAVEATAYFVVAEALTNVAKHAHARHAEVMARIDDGTLAVQVRDDGVGGARPDGSGLTGAGGPARRPRRRAASREPGQRRHPPRGRHSPPELSGPAAALNNGVATRAGGLRPTRLGRRPRLRGPSGVRRDRLTREERRRDDGEQRQ
jgi:GAF domain